MVRPDDIAVLQVGDGAGKLEDSMEGTAGQMKLFHGSAKQALGCRFYGAEFLHFFGCHVSVALQFRPLKALNLYFMCRLDSGSDFI